MSFHIFLTLLFLSPVLGDLSSFADEGDELSPRLRDFLQESYGVTTPPEQHYTHFLPRFQASIGYGSLVPIDRPGTEDQVLRLQISGAIANDTRQETSVLPFEMRFLLDRDIDERLSLRQIESIKVGVFRTLTDPSVSFELMRFVLQNSLSSPNLQWRGVHVLTLNISHSLWQSQNGKAELVLRGSFAIGSARERVGLEYTSTTSPDLTEIHYIEDTMGTTDFTLGMDFLIEDWMKLYAQVQASVQWNLSSDAIASPAQVLNWILGARFNLTTLEQGLRLSLEPQYREEVLYFPTADTASEFRTPRIGSVLRTGVPSLLFSMEW